MAYIRSEGPDPDPGTLDAKAGLSTIDKMAAKPGYNNFILIQAKIRKAPSTDLCV
jgi:hypothetical protein